MSIQKPKRWTKKPKVDVRNPNKMKADGYMNQPWEFSTKNRDRPTGHMRVKYRNGYQEGLRKKRFFGRLNNKFHINEE